MHSRSNRDRYNFAILVYVLKTLATVKAAAVLPHSKGGRYNVVILVYVLKTLKTVKAAAELPHSKRLVTSNRNRGRAGRAAA
jgi:hypothetical protein